MIRLDCASNLLTLSCSKCTRLPRCQKYLPNCLFQFCFICLNQVWSLYSRRCRIMSRVNTFPWSDLDTQHHECIKESCRLSSLHLTRRGLKLMNYTPQLYSFGAFHKQHARTMLHPTGVSTGISSRYHYLGRCSFKTYVRYNCILKDARFYFLHILSASSQ